MAWQAQALLENPFPRILCAVDGSRASRHAVLQALALASTDAELTFITVNDPDARGTAPAYAADAAVEAAFRAAGTAGVDAGLLVRHGADARRVILDEAPRHDLLVLGTHGHQRVAGFPLGATAAAALRRSPVPVLIARRCRAASVFPRDILLAADSAYATSLATRLATRHGARVARVHADERAPTARIAAAALELPAALVIQDSRVGVAPCSTLAVRSSLQRPYQQR